MPSPDLVSRLRAAGWDPSSEEVAEALWLARFTGARDAGGLDADSTAPRYAEGPTRQPEPPMPLPGHHETPEPYEPPRPQAERTAPVSLFAPRRHGGAPPAGFPVRAPAAGSLSGLLELQHALRPLHGYRPPLPPVAGEERQRFIRQAELDHMDYAILGDATWTFEEGVLTLRVDLGSGG